MQSSEQQSSSSDRLSAAGKRQPLYLRLYYQSHLTEIARLIGYNDVPVEIGREQLKPLVKKYGEQKIADGCEELLEIDNTKQPPVARLKTEVSKLAFQLLGPRRAIATNTAPPAAPERAETAAESTGATVKMPRHYVLGKFEEYLAASKMAFVTHAELRKSSPCLAILPALDYIVERKNTRLLVAVRPALRGNQAAQMIAYSDALLANHAPVRIWPVESAKGWEWQEHELFAGPLGMDSKRFKLSLDDWRAVHEHADGDKKCGRDWLTEGCACACCKAARVILTTSTAKRSNRK